MLLSRFLFIHRTFTLNPSRNELEMMRRHATHYRSGALKQEPRKLKTLTGLGFIFMTVVPCILLGGAISSFVADYLNVQFVEDDDANPERPKKMFGSSKNSEKEEVNTIRNDIDKKYCVDSIPPCLTGCASADDNEEKILI